MLYNLLNNTFASNNETSFNYNDSEYTLNFFVYLNYCKQKYNHIQIYCLINLHSV